MLKYKEYAHLNVAPTLESEVLDLISLDSISSYTIKSLALLLSEEIDIDSISPKDKEKIKVFYDSKIESYEDIEFEEMLEVFIIYLITKNRKLISYNYFIMSLNEDEYTIAENYDIKIHEKSKLITRLLTSICNNSIGKFQDFAILDSFYENEIILSMDKEILVSYMD